MMRGLVNLSVAVIVSIIVIVAMIPAIQIDHADSDYIDVVIIDGQSNALYSQYSSRVNPDVVNEYLDVPDKKAYYFGDSYGSISYGTYNNLSYDTTLDSYGIHEMYSGDLWTIGGLEPGIASGLIEKNHRDVLVINVAVGAAPISWLITDGWSIASDVIDTATEQIMEMYPGINKIGWIMVQGEADGRTPVSVYESRFLTLMGKFTNLGYEHCYSALPREGSENSRLAQIELAQKNRDLSITGIADTFTIDNGLLWTDNVHYTQKGRLVLSESLMEMVPGTSDMMESLATIISVVPVILIAGLVLSIVIYTKYRE